MQRHSQKKQGIAQHVSDPLAHQRPIERVKIPIEKEIRTAKLSAAALASGMKTGDGAQALLAEPKARLKALLQSMELLLSLRSPDSFLKSEQEALVANMKTLGGSHEFMLVFREALNEPENGRNLRNLVNDLYNSKTGKAALERGFGLLFGIRNLLDYTRLPDKARRGDFEYSKYPENEILVADLKPEQKAAYQSLMEYFKGGEPGEKERFFRFAREHPGLAADLVRAQEFRSVLSERLSEKAAARRIKELFYSDAGRKIIGRAMETAEGINTIGYLWNTAASALFVKSMVEDLDMVLRLPSVIKTVKLILDGQAEFAAQAEQGGTSYRDKPYWKNYGQ